MPQIIVIVLTCLGAWHFMVYNDSPRGVFNMPEGIIIAGIGTSIIHGLLYWGGWYACFNG